MSTVEDDWGAGDEDFSLARAPLLHDRSKVRGSLGRRQCRRLEIARTGDDDGSPCGGSRPCDIWCAPDDEGDRGHSAPEPGERRAEHTSSSARGTIRMSVLRQQPRNLDRMELAGPSLIVQQRAESCEAVINNPQLLPLRAGRACGSTVSPPEWRSDTLLRHDQRKLVTGTICLQVLYKDVRTPGQDVYTLQEGGCGRIFVDELRGGGQAFRSGVRPGDELVLVRNGASGTPKSPGGANCLKVLANMPSREADVSQGSKGPSVVLFFMGFAGKFPAEVRVTENREEPMCGILGVQDLVGTEAFAVCEEVVLQPRSAPLLLVPLESAAEDKRTGGSADGSEEALHIEAVSRFRREVQGLISNEASEASEASPVKGVLELEQIAAHQLLCRALMELSGQGHPAVAAWVHSRPSASRLKGGEPEVASAWNDVVDVLIGWSDEASRTSLSGTHSGVPAPNQAADLTFSLMCSEPPPPPPDAKPVHPQASRQAAAKDLGLGVPPGYDTLEAPVPPGFLGMQQTPKGASPSMSPASPGTASRRLGDHPDNVLLPSATLSVNVGDRPDSLGAQRNMVSPLVSDGDGVDHVKMLSLSTADWGPTSP